MYNQYFLLNSFYPDLYPDNINPEKEVTPYAPEKARQLLADSGWLVNDLGKLEKDGQSFEITFLSAAEDFRHLNLYIEDLKSVGIEAKIEKINRSTLTKRIDNFDFEMFWTAWGASRLRDPESPWHSSTADQKASQNYPGVQDDEIDRLIEMQKGEYDMDKRIEILKQIDNRLAEIIPYIFLWQADHGRILYWNKYQTPEYVFDKFGQEESIITYWWEDPAMVKELDQAMETDQAWPRNHLRWFTKNESLFSSAFIAAHSDLIGITAVCFTLIQFVPGGPVEELISRVRAQSNLEGGGGSTAQQQITEEEIENIRAYYGFDKPALTRYFEWLGKVVRFDLGTSYFYEEPVWDVIKSKFPISLFFGLVSFVLSYSICIPLGLYKAMWNRSRFDLISSIMIFAGYIIPGYALGILLIIFFSGGSYLDWFPLGGIVSENFESMGFWEGTADFLHHMSLPLVCFMASEFAFLTMLMKNSLLEEIRKEYVRTAMFKGATFGRAVWKHALRNAFYSFGHPNE